MKTTTVQSPESTVQLVPVSKLTLAGGNVRKFSPDAKADKALMENIAQVGVLQPLLVVQEGNQFAVWAGGRRLAALQALVRGKRLSKTALVPVMVREEVGAGESLAENVMREAMHPVDEFEAFTRMVKEGKTVADIATQFGVTQVLVKQRLALGNIHPTIREAVKAGKTTLGALKAFTLARDLEHQLEVYTELAEEGALQEWQIRQHLSAKTLSPDSPVARLVGVKAYKRAGGVVVADLFGDNDYWAHPDIAYRLANDLLAKAVDDFDATGWAWVKCGIQPDDFIASCAELEPEDDKYPETVRDEIAKLWEAMQDAEEEAEDTDDWDAYHEAEEAHYAAEADAKHKYLRFSDEQKARSGVFITISRNGSIAYEEGLIPRSELKKQGESAGQGDSAPSVDNDDNQQQGISAALSNDLAAHRQIAAMAHIAKHPSIAAELLHYTICASALKPLGDLDGGYYSVGCGALSIVPHIQRPDSSQEDIPAGIAQTALDARVAALPLDWIKEADELARFTAYRALSGNVKAELLALAVSRSITVGVRGDKPLMDAVLDETGLAMSEYWQANDRNYFGRLTVPQLSRELTLPAGGTVDFHAAGTKKELVRQCAEWADAQAKAGAPWLPPQL